MAKVVKKRYWAFCLYEESAPADWRDRLQQTGLPVAISPEHDRDLDPTGQPKKKHRHVILCYSGPTTYTAVKALTDSLNQPIPQPLESVKGYYRYLTHKDNPEKAQYNEEDIETLNGFEIGAFVELTKLEIIALKQKVQSLIREKDFTEYGDLMDYLQDENMTTEYDIASSHTIFFGQYIRSRRHGRQKTKVVQVDENGEIIE